MDRPLFNAYIDGFNLYHGALERRPDLKWLDLVGLCTSLLPDMELDSVFYFTAPIKKRFPEDSAPDRQHAYLRVLANEGVNIVFGKFRKDNRWLRLAAREPKQTIEPNLPEHVGLTRLAFSKSFQKSNPDIPKAFVSKLEEKGSDVNLGSYLLRDSYLSHIKAALVLTGDSDLATPISFSVQSGVNVLVVVPGMAIAVNDLARACSNLQKLDIRTLEKHQYPTQYLSPSGRRIVRPKDWT